jgi:hypothetical protein
MAMGDPVTSRRTFHLRQLMVAVAGVALLLGFLVWAARNGISWWASQAMEGSFYFYPRLAWAAGTATLIALIVMIADRRSWRSRTLWLLLPLALPVALLAFGIAFQHVPGDGVAASTVEQRRIIVEWFPWLHVPVGIVLLGCFRSASNWLIIGCISTVAVWLCFGSQFMSWMSVTNVWL